MGFRNPTYSLWLQPCCFTYRTVGTFSISVLKLCEFILGSKNFHSEPARIFFHRICLFSLTCSVLLSVSFRLVTLFVFVFLLSASLCPWSKLFPWTMEDSSEVDDIVSTSSTSAWAEFIHYGSVEGFFLVEKLVIFEFELKLWLLITNSFPLGVCFPICLCIFVVGTCSWFIRSSPRSESRFNHIFIFCNISETVIIIPFSRCARCGLWKSYFKKFGKFLEKQPRRNSYLA